MMALILNPVGCNYSKDVPHFCLSIFSAFLAKEIWDQMN